MLVRYRPCLTELDIVDMRRFARFVDKYKLMLRSVIANPCRRCFWPKRIDFSAPYMRRSPRPTSPGDGANQYTENVLTHRQSRSRDGIWRNAVDSGCDI